MLFKKTIRNPRSCVLVSLLPQQDGLSVRYAVIRQKDIGAAVQWTEVATAGELVKKAGKHLPYVLHFNGFGVLARIAENVPGYRETLLVTGSEDDFYFSSYELNGTVGVSFLRRSLVDPFIDELRAAKVFLWAAHTGPVPLIALLPPNGSLDLDYSIALSNGDLKTLARNDGDMKKVATDGGFLDRDDAYAAAIAQLTFHPTEAYRQGWGEEQLTAVRSDYKEYVRFVRLGIGVLAFFLVSLTANYFYVNHLNDTAAQLESDISGYGESLSLMGRLEQEKQRKLVLADNSGVQSSRYVSYYLDDIGGSVPAAVQLTSLETFPLAEPLKPKRKVALNMRQIVVTGFSGSSKVLDDWMEDIERRKWVSGVELISYVRINDRKATFHLLVKLAE